MAFVYGDRVKETSLSEGSGLFTLDGPVNGFVDFAAGVGLGNECFYCIVNSFDDSWEMGRGTVGAGSLSRDLVYSSSNVNNIVFFNVGNKVVFTTDPDTLYSSILDQATHELEDHTIGPLNLLDHTAHLSVDHTAAPLNLISAPSHQVIDHTLAPFNLIDQTVHEAIDHTAAPLSLLDETAHGLVDHLASPLFLMDILTHNSLSHASVPDVNYAPVSVPERTTGILEDLRSFTPNDIKVMAELFGVGGGATPLQVASFGPSLFSWSVTGNAINTGPIGFAPLVAFAFGAFAHSNTPVVGLNSSLSIGAATPSTAFSHGQVAEHASSGGAVDNNDTTTYAAGSIAGFSAGSGSFKSAWDIATISAAWDTPFPDQITLTPSTAITGNITLIVLG